ncbi:acyl-CoA dehydrogenase [Haloactinopolyspora alba]|uniref:acyl-CoA dehydrogenase family protein n=1 Tax=Haloactinopolyspora alba TaxID=648780 RepID=UPI00197A9FD9|nr:acyl-CoA dehydrogenase [Haloactinopolyspora alba]
MIRSVLDGRWAESRRAIRALADDPLFHPVSGLSVEAYRDRVWHQMTTLAADGRIRVGFPAAHGGADDVGSWITMFETLAHADLSLLVKAGVQWGLFGSAVLHLGTRHHHERYLDDIITLRLPGCFAMTETGHGSDVQALRTTAVHDPATDEFVVHTPDADARKDYIGNAARDGRSAVVFAQLTTADEEHGVHAFLVPIRADDGSPLAGVTIGDCGDKAGLRGVDNGRLGFDRVRVARENLLDRYAQVAADGSYTSPIANPNRRFFTMLGTLVQGRVSVAGASGSATKSALTIAVRYAERRRQFTVPGTDDEVAVLDYRAHQRRLLPALATTYAMHFAQSQLVEELRSVLGGDDTHAQRELESRAAGLKAVATAHATTTIQECREACGGAGYLSENRLPQLKADTDVFTTFEGDNTVLLQLVAKELLTGYREQFGNLDFSGTVRFVSEQVVETVVERTAGRSLIQRLVDAVPGRDEDADLRDRGYQLKLFESREKHLLDGAARRLRRASGATGTAAFDAFNEVQDHLLTAARAHVDRVVLEAFVAAIDTCADTAATALLDRVCDLYALSTIEAHRGWYLEHDRLSPARSKAVTATVNELCAELRPHARQLVDAFAVPDAFLGAAILD